MRPIRLPRQTHHGRMIRPIPRVQPNRPDHPIRSIRTIPLAGRDRQTRGTHPRIPASTPTAPPIVPVTRTFDPPERANVPPKPFSRQSRRLCRVGPVNHSCPSGHDFDGSHTSYGEPCHAL
jgi:hypothetical protein